MGVRAPLRSAVKEGDTWDLSKLYASDTSWDHDLAALQKRIGGYRRLEGSLANSSQALESGLKYDSKVDRLAERLGAYASLRLAEDQARNAKKGLWAMPAPVPPWQWRKKSP